MPTYTFPFMTVGIEKVIPGPSRFARSRLIRVVQLLGNLRGILGMQYFGRDSVVIGYFFNRPHYCVGRSVG